MVRWCCPGSTPISTRRRGGWIGGVSDEQGKFTEHPASNHPQYAMHALLERFGIKRRDVGILGTPAPDGRDVLALGSDAVHRVRRRSGLDRLARPEIAAHIARGMKNLAVIAAPNPEMEALAIAIAMREARHLGRIGRAGDAGPRTGAAGDGGAGALESRL